jgi:ribosomal protein S18 acetylase RimI-like enzyme
MTDAEINLRAVTTADADFLRGVYASTRTEELAATDWSEQQKAEFCRQQFAAQDRHYREHYPTAHFSIIEINGNPVGRLYVDRWPHEIRIMDIALLPGCRGQGIATRLLRELLAEGSAQRKKVSIHVETFNPARHLYERLGFQKVGATSIYDLLEWTPESGNVERGIGDATALTARCD